METGGNGIPVSKVWKTTPKIKDAISNEIDLKNDDDLPEQQKLKTAGADVERMALSRTAGGNKKHVHTTTLETSSL